MKKPTCVIITFLMILALLLAVPVAASAQEVNEWSQYQKNERHGGAIPIDLPATNAVSRRTDDIGAVDGSQPVVAGGMAYVYAGVAGSSGAIYCYDLTTGEKVWNTSVAPISSNVSWSSPAVEGGVVYIGSGSKVQALDAADGDLLWTKDLTTIKASADVVNSSPAIDGNRLVIGDFFNGCYYCLDITQKGKWMWTFALDASSMALSTPCISGGSVFVGQQGPYGAPNGKVWCVDEATGRAVTAWGNHGYYAAVDQLDISGTVSAYGDFIYFTDFSYDPAKTCHLYCLSKSTGAEAWKVSAYGSDGAPSVVDGLVVTAGEQYGVSNWVSAYTADTIAGKNPVLKWKVPGIGGYTMSACIANGKVAVGNGVSGWPPVTCTDSYVLNASDGSTVWHSTEAGGPPAATAYGILSIGDGKMVTFGTGSVPNSDYYFAEGTTREGYQEWICLENPTAGKVDSSIEYMINGGGTVKQSVELQPGSRTTVDVNSFVGGGLDVSARVTGNGHFVAERSVYFNAGGLDGGEQVMGATAPGKRFLFAEGTTRDGFQTWLALQNPADSDASVLVTYLHSDGSPPDQQNVTVRSRSRETVDVNAGAGAGRDVSIALTSNRAIVGERVMYFRYPGQILGASPSGVHNCTGVAEAGTAWQFAEGATYANFQEWLCLMNPGNRDTTANIRYMNAAGPIKTVPMTLKANSRTTVDVNAEVGPDQDVSALVTSLDPIVAERPMYFQFLPNGMGADMWKGGHNSVGTEYAAYKWEFAEGCTRNGFRTYLCVSNPNGKAVQAQVHYFITRADGGKEDRAQTLELAANSRQTVVVNDFVGEGRDVSAAVTCGTPIVVERPMYFSYGKYTDGGVSLGLPVAP
jgi:outer membrane protein assembly factor BamB